MTAELKPCNKKNMKKVVVALRAGKYHQTKGKLCGVVNKQSYHCCLGVSCRIAIKNGVNVIKKNTGGMVGFDSEGYSLPKSVVNFLGIDSSDPMLMIPPYLRAKAYELESSSASILNDEYEFTFKEIADCFEYTYLNRKIKND